LIRWANIKSATVPLINWQLEVNIFQRSGIFLFLSHSQLQIIENGSIVSEYTHLPFLGRTEEERKFNANRNKLLMKNTHRSTALFQCMM
jgi:hypothetical protein